MVVVDVFQTANDVTMPSVISPDTRPRSTEINICNTMTHRRIFPPTLIRLVFCGFLLSRVFQKQVGLLRELTAINPVGLVEEGLLRCNLFENVSQNDEIILAEENGNRATNNTFNVIPRRHIAIFGLESSGTTFLTDTIAKALNANVNSMKHLSFENTNRDVLIHHISLPWGYYGGNVGIPKQQKQITYNETVVYPPRCMRHPHAPTRERFSLFCETEAQTKERRRYPHRFFVNITSHVRWYQARGSQVTAILMIRDDLMHHQNKLKTHAHGNINTAHREDLIGKRIMAEAIQTLSTHSSPTQKRDMPELVITSYETLMAMKENYLFWLYRQLGVNSTFVPTFKNGNAKYISQK